METKLCLGGGPDFSKSYSKFALVENREKFPEISPTIHRPKRNFCPHIPPGRSEIEFSVTWGPGAPERAGGRGKTKTRKRNGPRGPDIAVAYIHIYMRRDIHLGTGGIIQRTPLWETGEGVYPADTRYICISMYTRARGWSSAGGR